MAVLPAADITLPRARAGRGAALSCPALAGRQDKRFRSRDAALRTRVLPTPRKAKPKASPKTPPFKEGRRSAERRTTGPHREAMRRAPVLLSSPLREDRGRRDLKKWSGRARLSAPHRGIRGFGPRLGSGRASWNHRMQTGGPSPAPVQRAPRGPARAGRDDAQTACRLSATNAARRNRTRSVSRRHRLTSLTMNGMDAVIQIRARAVKGFSIYADKSRGCAGRLPLRASPDAFHSVLKIRKSEVVPVNQGFLCGTNVFGAAQRRPYCTAAGRLPLVP